MRLKDIIHIFMLMLHFLLLSLFAKAQLSASDSVWFSQIFNSPIYASNPVAPDSFYIHNNISSTTELNNILDTVYKFSLNDFKVIDALILNDSIYYDSVRNTTFNRYPLAYNQQDPLTYINFELNGKKGRAYNFLFPRTSPPHIHCNRAFLLVPGNGNNSASELVQGYGQYNELCYLSNNLRPGGDVYAMMKPNEDARAIYWNKRKLDNSVLVTMLEAKNHRYGLNYLVELIATIKLLKQKYSQVVLLGAAEGGYASTLASMVTHPFSTVISGGYTIAFDTSMNSFNILSQRFDSLVSFYDRNAIKNNILANYTKYLFAWGDKEPIVLMQAEHDSNYTENFFNDTTKISYDYNFTGHTFPYCKAIDSFLINKVDVPPVSFSILDTSKKDTISALVQNCNIADTRFDLFKNHVLYRTYNFFKGDTVIHLVDSGVYYLKNISSIYDEISFCSDSIYFNKKAKIPVKVNFGIQYNNPVNNLLIIKTNLSNTARSYELSDLFGNRKLLIESKDTQIEVNMSQYPQGVYLLIVKEGVLMEFDKIIKL